MNLDGFYGYFIFADTDNVGYVKFLSNNSDNVKFG
jgi:hypothetical protein